MSNIFENDLPPGSSAYSETAANIANVPAGNVSATNVQAAINELDTEKAGLTILAAGGGAALVGNTPAGNISSVTVQAAINELDTEKAALAGSASQTFSVAVPTSAAHAVRADGVVGGFKNKIINANFSINQRAPATNADDTYAHDRWYVLTQTGTIAVSTLTDVEDTTPRMARLTQSQAVAQRMGYAQIIEGINCKHLRGQTVTFKFGRERLSASANIRIAILEWTGTEDTVTSDVVLDWTSATYTAGNFFLAANLTVSGVVQQALTANTLTDGSSVTVTLGSSFNNLIVFVWTEGTVAQNVTLDLGKAQLEAGQVASTFEAIDAGEVLRQCQRYYWYMGGAINSFQLRGYNTAGAALSQTIIYPVEFRTTPTITIGTVTYSNASGLSFNPNSPRHTTMSVNVTASGDAYVTANGSNLITFSAEL